MCYPLTKIFAFPFWMFTMLKKRRYVYCKHMIWLFYWDKSKLPHRRSNGDKCTKSIIEICTNVAISFTARLLEDAACVNSIECEYSIASRCWSLKISKQVREKENTDTPNLVATNIWACILWVLFFLFSNAEWKWMITKIACTTKRNGTHSQSHTHTLGNAKNQNKSMFVVRE